MEEFVEKYGIWILLGGIFLAMHWFGGMGCGGGHRHGAESDEGVEKTDKAGKRTVHSGRSGGCH